MAEENSRTPREETTLERADRNYGELLQELRIIQTGVQILFAFLLTLAFTARFPILDTAQRTMYITTLLLAVLAAALFTAPAALHRTLFQSGAKPEIVMISSLLAGAGMGVLMLALSGCAARCRRGARPGRGGDRGQCDAAGVRRPVGAVAAVRQAARRTVRSPGCLRTADRIGLRTSVSKQPPPQRDS